VRKSISFYQDFEHFSFCGSETEARIPILHTFIVRSRIRKRIRTISGSGSTKPINNRSTESAPGSGSTTLVVESYLAELNARDSRQAMSFKKMLENQALTRLILLNRHLFLLFMVGGGDGRGPGGPKNRLFCC
jgi:hypothetical protein